MIDQPGNSVEQDVVHKAGTPARPWSRFPFVLAIVLTLFSIICSAEGPLWILNLLVIAPLWAAAAVLFFTTKVKRVLAIVAIVLSATIVSMFQTAILAAREGRPRRLMTHNTMKYTLEQIQVYLKEHRQAPPSLQALPVEERSSYEPVDEWGHDLQYSVDRDGVITLTSFGADGKPGGDGQNADIIMHYRTRNADGTLNVDGHWIEDAKAE
jgi:hypothetical protein